MSRLKYDPEFLPKLMQEQAALSTLTWDLNELDKCRTAWEKVQELRNSHIREATDVEVTVHQICVADGDRIRVYRVCPSSLLPGSSQTVPSILHAHAGGMILGSAALGLKRLKVQASECNVQIFSVDYRLAPESPHPGPAEDCYAALEWLASKAKEFNIDTARIGVMGESAGGGLAASVALMARDRGFDPPLAKQILIYPMIDDRTISRNPELDRFVIWDCESNRRAWSALLGGMDKVGAYDTDPYAAPARAHSVAGLPSTYIEVGNLDIFCDQAVEYAHRIIKENIDCELHVYAGVTHSFETIAPRLPVNVRATHNLNAAMTSF